VIFLPGGFCGSTIVRQQLLIPSSMPFFIRSHAVDGVEKQSKESKKQFLLQGISAGPVSFIVFVLAYVLLLCCLGFKHTRESVNLNTNSAK